MIDQTLSRDTTKCYCVYKNNEMIFQGSIRDISKMLYISYNTLPKRFKQGMMTWNEYSFEYVGTYLNLFTLMDKKGNVIDSGSKDYLSKLTGARPDSIVVASSYNDTYLRNYLVRRNGYCIVNDKGCIVYEEHPQEGDVVC